MSMSMSSLFLLVKVLVFAGLHLMYLAQSLVVVEYRSHASSGRGRLWQLQQNNNNNHRFQAQSPRHAGVAFASASASTTAIAFASTEKNSNNISDHGSSSSSSPPLSLKEILNELTVRGIAFSPLASKAELEELLKRKDNLDGYVAESRSSEPEDNSGSPQNDTAPSSTKQQPQHPPPSTSTETETETETTVPSASEGLGDGSEVRSNRNPQSNREGKRRIEDRLQRRTNRTRRSARKQIFGEENIAPGSPLPPSSPSSRQQRQQERKDRHERIGKTFSDDSGSDSVAGGEDEFERAKRVVFCIVL